MIDFTKSGKFGERMQPLSLNLFGDVKLTHSVHGDIALPRKTQMLLAYLAKDGGSQLQRDLVAGSVWNDRPEDKARHSLRQCLFALSKSIGDDTAPLVQADRRYLSLNSDSVNVDTWRFEQLLVENEPDAMRQAVALYNADFATGISYEDELLDNWCATERARFRELYYDTLAKVSAHYTDIAKLDEAIEAARRLVTLDPLREDGHRTLMRLLGRAGRRAEAIKQYSRCREILRLDLNVEPEAATTNLYSEIKEDSNKVATEPELAAPSPDADKHQQEIFPVTANRGRVTLIVGLILITALAITMFWLLAGQSS